MLNRSLIKPNKMPTFYYFILDMFKVFSIHISVSQSGFKNPSTVRLINQFCSSDAIFPTTICLCFLALILLLFLSTADRLIRPAPLRCPHPLLSLCAPSSFLSWHLKFWISSEDPTLTETENYTLFVITNGGAGFILIVDKNVKVKKC